MSKQLLSKTIQENKGFFILPVDISGGLNWIEMPYKNFGVTLLKIINKTTLVENTTAKIEIKYDNESDSIARPSISLGAKESVRFKEEEPNFYLYSSTVTNSIAVLAISLHSRDSLIFTPDSPSANVTLMNLNKLGLNGEIKEVAVQVTKSGTTSGNITILTCPANKKIKVLSLTGGFISVAFNGNTSFWLMKSSRNEFLWASPNTGAVASGLNYMETLARDFNIFSNDIHNTLEATEYVNYWYANTLGGLFNINAYMKYFEYDA